MCAISPHLQVLVCLDKPSQNAQGEEGAVVCNTGQPQILPPAPKKATYKEPRAHGWGGHGGYTQPLHQMEGGMLWHLFLVTPSLGQGWPYLPVPVTSRSLPCELAQVALKPCRWCEWGMLSPFARHVRAKYPCLPLKCKWKLHRDQIKVSSGSKQGLSFPDNGQP